MADALLSGERKAILLGNAAAQHPQASQLLALATVDRPSTPAPASVTWAKPATAWARSSSARCLAPAACTPARCSPQPMKALLLLNTEPVLDSADAAAARQALAGVGPGRGAHAVQGRGRPTSPT